jgi:chemotaxis protein MotA
MGFVGCIITLVGVFGGFLGAGGHMHVLIQPFEVLIIGGAALGGFVIANPMSTIKMTISKTIHALLGGGPGKKDYVELLQLLFQLSDLS